MSGKDVSSVKSIVSIFYVGSLCSVLLLLGAVFQFFKQDVIGQTLFWLLILAIYVSYYVSGVIIVKSYVPEITRFVMRHKLDIADIAMLGLVVILLIIEYLAIVQSSVILAILFAIILEQVVSATIRRIWKRLKKKYKWLRDIEKKPKNKRKKPEKKRK